VRESVASRKKRFLAAALLQRQYDIMTSLAATLQPIKRSEGRLQQPISSQRADTKRIKGELPSKKKLIRRAKSASAGSLPAIESIRVCLDSP